MGLVILLVISVLSMSSIRLSIMDVLISSNEEQQMLVSQASETASKKVVTFYHLFNWLDTGSEPAAVSREIKDAQVTSTVNLSAGDFYPCFGQSGEAMSLGPAAPKCRVYSFDIDSKIKGTGARSKLSKGEGKEFPNAHGNIF